MVQRVYGGDYSAPKTKRDGGNPSARGEEMTGFSENKIQASPVHNKYNKSHARTHVVCAAEVSHVHRKFSIRI